MSQGTFQILGGVVQGAAATISAGPGTEVRVANSALHGGAAAGGGVFRCAAITDEGFQFSATSCP